MSRHGRGPRQPTRQESRIGVKGDPTPDHEYKDEPEHPSAHIDEDEDSNDPRKKVKCVDCGNTKKVSREEFGARGGKPRCMRMTFDPETGEVPCGGDMEEVEE